VLLAVVDWSAVTAVFTGVISVGVALAAFQLLDTRKQQRAEIARELSKRWDSKEMVEARRLVNGFRQSSDLHAAVKLADRRQDDETYIFSRYLSFFEELGVISQHTPGAWKIIDALLGSTVIQGWEIWKPIIHDVWGAQTAQNFGRLAQKLRTEREWRALLPKDLQRPDP